MSTAESDRRGAADAATPGRGPALVGLLALALALELLLNRIGARLTHLEPLSPLGRLRDVLDVAGLFSFHFVSVLAVLLAALTLLRDLAEPTSPDDAAAESRGATIVKGATVLFTVGFVTVSILGVAVRLPERLHLYLLFLFLYLAAQQLRVAVRSRAVPGRAKAWLALAVLAYVLHSAWLASIAMEVENASRVPRSLLSVGEALAVTLAVVSPATFSRRPWRLDVGVLVGLVVGGAALAVALVDWELAARIAAYGFGVELPAATAGSVLYALALGAWAAATTSLLAQGGTTRLRGWGLLILGLAAYHVQLPYQLAAMLVGLACVVDGFRREAVRELDPGAFRITVQRVAAAVGATEATNVGAALDEARIRTAHGDVVVEVALGRRGGMLARVEIAVGVAPESDAPPLSLHARRGPRLGRRTGAEVRVGDDRFDEAYAVFDARTIAGPDAVLADDVRGRLVEARAGWIGVWPGDGARYRSVDPDVLDGLSDDGAPDRVRYVVELLLELRRRR